MTRLIRFRPPRIALGCFACSLALHFLLGSGSTAHPPLPAVGLSVFGLGFSLMMWAWWCFQKSGTPLCPTEAPSQFVTRGPFRLSRNPMYLGMLAMLVGCSVVFGSTPMYVAPIVFGATMQLVFIPYEEKRLEELFGADYRSYKRSVRRWI